MSAKIGLHFFSSKIGLFVSVSDNNLTEDSKYILGTTKDYNTQNLSIVSGGKNKLCGTTGKGPLLWSPPRRVHTTDASTYEIPGFFISWLQQYRKREFYRSGADLEKFLGAPKILNSCCLWNLLEGIHWVLWSIQAQFRSVISLAHGVPPAPRNPSKPAPVI